MKDYMSLGMGIMSSIIGGFGVIEGVWGNHAQALEWLLCAILFAIYALYWKDAQ